MEQSTDYLADIYSPLPRIDLPRQGVGIATADSRRQRFAW